jgi:hypothetical protein
LAESVPAQTFVNEICNTTNGQENKWTDDRVHVHIKHSVLADGICLPRQDQMLMKQAGQVIELVYYLALAS